MYHKALATLTFLALLALTAPGCVTTPVDTYGAVYGPPVEHAYEPLLYDGYVVYYTDIGEPFYWSGGARVWVPPYARAPYVRHWQRYKQAYPTWYKHRGDYDKDHRFTGPRGKPSGPAGGPGSNRRSPFAPVGGSDTSPGRPLDAPSDRDRDGISPRFAGGPGTYWEHRPRPAGGLETSPDRGLGAYRSRDGNPPGPTGRVPTNRENPPGPAGGPGLSPDRRPRGSWSPDTDRPSAIRGTSTNQKSRPGPADGAGAPASRLLGSAGSSDPPGLFSGSRPRTARVSGLRPSQAALGPRRNAEAAAHVRQRQVQAEARARHQQGQVEVQARRQQRVQGEAQARQQQRARAKAPALQQKAQAAAEAQSKAPPRSWQGFHNRTSLTGGDGSPGTDK